MKRPRRLLPEFFKKNETVMGTMGNTHGVSRATKPHAMASRMTDHSEVPFAPAGASSAAASTTLSLEAILPAAGPGSRSFIVFSSGVRHCPSLQTCHSMVEITSPPEEASTLCTITTGEEQTPTSILKALS